MKYCVKCSNKGIDEKYGVEDKHCGRCGEALEDEFVYCTCGAVKPGRFSKGGGKDKVKWCSVCGVKY